ncbi:class I SAM-dependent methyltransferase [Roseomonas sp. SSH11]|uniref:Class I SAM-dependent methyltransferase n=1 Tax=Pararoseomonas baculiformis TaxID=2820812 RepID=A0ABS4AKT7_9PROT|nr:class I SAM-dependent methyltransferase [Pararoseomonas baculiformis]MBP0447113.1 class I SAM-dependent methyltransferase [Pararoseomonas baculiformis]
MTQRASDAPSTGTAPHPVLAHRYAHAGEREGFVRALFDATAPHYDRIDRIFSLGTGPGYRRRALREAGLRPGMRVLDVAVGTGLVARQAVAITGDPALVTGLDPSEGMLAEARKTLPGVTLIQGRAEKIPLPDASVDFLSMGYALRHVADLGAAFAEYRRVLKPGGTVLLLEIGRPESRLAHVVERFYMGAVIPALCWIAAPRHRSGELMKYYWETIEACVPAEAILGALRKAGFTDPACTTELEVFRAYTARA